MASYIGFSTINANKLRSTNLSPGPAGGTGSVVQPIIYGKKFRLVDDKLVIQDLVNAFNIQQGQKVGNPSYGTSVWSYIFAPNTIDVQQNIIAEVRRVAKADPRIIVNTVNAFTQDNGILIEVELAVLPNNQAQLLNIFFNSSSRVAAIQ